MTTEDGGVIADGALVGKGDVSVVTVSIDLGAGRRGVDMGPSAIRIAGLNGRIAELGYRVLEGGSVTASGPETAAEGGVRMRFLAEVTEVARRSCEFVTRALESGSFPLILGGDHSISIGTVAAVSEYHARRSGEAVGLLWVDAHTDMNTPETTPSGNIHGMSLAILTGQGGPDALQRMAGFSPAVQARNVCVLGARAIDGPEKEAVRAAGIRVFTMTEIDERGMAACLDEAIERACDGTAGFHLSFDLDGIDPMVAPGVGTAVAGGLTYREAHLACEKVARSGALLAAELVELNPVLDVENRTGRLAVELLASVLGKTIL